MEHLVNFIIWTFTLLGITTIVTTSRILCPIRTRIQNIHSSLGSLISCPPCFGFWAGIILSVCYQTITGSTLFDAFLASGLMWYLVTPTEE